MAHLKKKIFFDFSQQQKTVGKKKPKKREKIACVNGILFSA